MSKQAISGDLTVTHRLSEGTKSLLRELLKPRPIILIVAGQSIHIPGLTQGDDMSYTVARDHADEPFTLDPIVVADSEGPG